jgi:hypothetical protein
MGLRAAGAQKSREKHNKTWCAWLVKAPVENVNDSRFRRELHRMGGGLVTLVKNMILYNNDLYKMRPLCNTFSKPDQPSIYQSLTLSPFWPLCLLSPK